MIVWQSRCAGPIAARVGLAGDFLPAGDLHPPKPGWSEAARSIAPLFVDCAASFVNLECSLDSDNLQPRPPIGIGQTVSAASASLDYLQALGCTVVGSANNHAFDFGLAGADRTRAAVARAGMVPLGVARNLQSTPDVWVWQGPGGIRVGFWAGAIASRDLATRNSAGVEPGTAARAAKAIAELKARGARISFALLHAGTLRTNRIDPAELRLMDAIARCGFSVLAASHSHRISGARILAPAAASTSFCFYGLGSIVSGFSAGPLEREGLVVIAGLTSGGQLASVEVRPVELSSSGFGTVPSPRHGDAILDRFRRLSAELSDGSSADLFYREVGRGLVRLYARDIGAAIRQSGISGLAAKARRLRVRHVQRLIRAVLP